MITSVQDRGEQTKEKELARMDTPKVNSDDSRTASEHEPTSTPVAACLEHQP